MYYLYYLASMFLLYTILSPTSIYSMSEPLFSGPLLPTISLLRAIQNKDSEDVKDALLNGAICDQFLFHQALFNSSEKVVKVLLDNGIFLNEFHHNLIAYDKKTIHYSKVFGISRSMGPGNALSIALYLHKPSLIYLLLRYGATYSDSYDRALLRKYLPALGAEGVFFSALSDDNPTNLPQLFAQETAHSQTAPKTALDCFISIFKSPVRPYMLNTPNCYGKTPLMLAAIAGKEQITRFLLHAGANTELKDAQGNTAYTLARWYHNNHIAELIENYIPAVTNINNSSYL